MRARRGSRAVARKTSQARAGGAECGAQHTELRLPQLGSVEGQRRDQQRHREADSGDRAATRDGGPADRRPQPPPAQPRHQPGDADHPDRLAEHVAEEDPEHDRRRVRPREEVPVDRDADVGQREQRHDRRSSSRDGRGAACGRSARPLPRSPAAGRAGQLRRRLLAEAAKQIGRSLQLAATRWIGPGDQAHRQAQYDRIDARLEQRHPGSSGKEKVDETLADPGGASDEDQAEDPGGDQQRLEGDVAAVGEGDHQQGDHVVDDDDRQQEAAQPVGEPRPDQRQHTQGERGIGRHRHAPSVAPSSPLR